MAYIGLDLGTTFSLAAEYNPETKLVTIIPDEESGENSVPSVVYYPESGEPIVGQQAIHAGDYAGDRLVRQIKMSMGDDFKVKIGDREYTPPEVSAEILKKLKKNVEAYFNLSPNDVDKFWQDSSLVITVPAYFEHPHNFATQEAARLAGFDMSRVRLFPEPCAAALAYVVQAGANLDAGLRRVLVSDLGGGTYDVTMIETKPFTAPDGRTHLDIAITCKDGSRELGGVLWDRELQKYVIELCDADKAGGHSPIDTGDASALHWLLEKVIRAKENLSKEDSVMISCCTGKSQKVSRGEFEERTESLFTEFEEKLRAVLGNDREMQKAQGKGDTEILGPDMVLLAGSASKMPQVEQRLLEVTGLKPQTHKSLGQIVAIGAAYEAVITAGKDDKKEGKDVPELKIKGQDGGDIVLIPPTSILGWDIGIKAYNPALRKYVNVVVLEKGTRQEVEKGRDDFSTKDDNQPGIDFVLLQGEDGCDADDCIVLGDAVLALPPGQPRGTPVKVLLKLSSDSQTIVGNGICITTEGDRECPIEIRRPGIAVPDRSWQEEHFK